jgi:hypothetical protein
MKADNPARHFAMAFLIALIGYVICYQSIQYWRTRKGPWEVTFSSSSNSAPSILVRQPRLGITNVQIILEGHGSTNQTSTRIVFHQPRPVPYDVPFGSCVFMDTISLPGTVTFEMFGHVIELLPRVLIIDRREYPWRSTSTIHLEK